MTPADSKVDQAGLAVVLSAAVQSVQQELDEDRQIAHRAQTLATEAMHALDEGHTSMAHYLAARAAFLHEDYGLFCDRMQVPDAILASEFRVGEGDTTDEGSEVSE